MKKITVFHRGALGDFLLACPVFQGLAELMNAEVYFISRREHVTLVKNKPFFAGFMPHDSSALTAFYDNLLWEKAEIPDPLTKSEAIFFFGQRSLRDVVSRLNKRLEEHKCYWIQSFPPPDAGIIKHVTLFLRDQLEELGFPVKIKPFNPLEDEENPDGASPEKNPPVIIHPGSGGLKKIWPLRNWWITITYILENYPETPITLVVGPADDVIRPMAYRSKELFGVSIVENPELMQLAVLLRRSRIYMGNDSGVSHLAAAVGIPCCIIFGPTNPDVWAPMGKDVTIVRDLWDESEIFLTGNASLHPQVKSFIDSRITC